jgi:hypothetical protein
MEAPRVSVWLLLFVSVLVCLGVGLAQGEPQGAVTSPGMPASATAAGSSPPAATPLTAPSASLPSLGATIAEVRTALGPPRDSQSVPNGEIWNYSGLQVYFQGGKVSGWYKAPAGAGPSGASVSSTSPASPTAELKLGSTAAEVKALLGPPNRMTKLGDADVWWYGQSQVYLRGGVVWHWLEVDHPLQVATPSPNFGTSPVKPRARRYASGSTRLGNPNLGVRGYGRGYNNTARSRFGGGYQNRGYGARSGYGGGLGGFGGYGRRF